MSRPGRWITSHVMNQDFVAWVGQGTIADRTQEHLGESDRGIILMRQRMLEEAAVVADGGDPKALVRDPEQEPPPAPAPHPRGARRAAVRPPDAPRPMVFHAGQPREIIEDMQRVLGRAQERLTMATLVGVFNMAHSPFCYMPPERWNEVRATARCARTCRWTTSRRTARRLRASQAGFAHAAGRSWRGEAGRHRGLRRRPARVLRLQQLPVLRRLRRRGVRGLRSRGGGSADASPGHPELGRRPAHRPDAARLRPGVLHGHAQARARHRPRLPAPGRVDHRLHDCRSCRSCSTATTRPSPRRSAATSSAGAVREVIEAHPDDLRVAVVGSGGLWHTPGAKDA